MYGYQPMFPASYRREVIRVNGRGGVDAYRMPSNSSELLLDETAPLVWLVQTDGAGYKTATAFDLTPHVDAAPVDIGALAKRIERLEGILNDKSDTGADDGE